MAKYCVMNGRTVYDNRDAVVGVQYRTIGCYTKFRLAKKKAKKLWDIYGEGDYDFFYKICKMVGPRCENTGIFRKQKLHQTPKQRRAEKRHPKPELNPF